MVLPWSRGGLDILGRGPFPLGLIGAGVGGGDDSLGRLVTLASDAVRKALSRLERFVSGVKIGLDIGGGGSDCDRLTEEARNAFKRARRASSPEQAMTVHRASVHMIEDRGDC